MLVLSRRVNEEIIIGDNIRITISRINGSRVSIGVSAPDDVKIMRGELHSIVNEFADDQPATITSPAFGFSESRPVRAAK